MRLAVDARVPQQIYGGVQQIIVGLATGLSDLEGEDEYWFLGNEDSQDWLAQYLGGPCRLLKVPASLGQTRRRATFEKLSGKTPRLGRLAARAASAFGRVVVAIPASDGFVESLQPDAIHFTTQQAFVTQVPSIYQVHDLQHVHRPELLTPLQVKYREVAYRAFCDQATLVAVMTEWGRSDVCSWAGLARERVAVVPWAPAAGLTASPGASGGGMAADLPERFLLYPAQTWPHKNHKKLLEAIWLLRTRGFRVSLVCTGRRNDYYPEIERRVNELGLSDAVRFTGYVSDADLAALYGRATALVFPSLFEGWGLPVVEAFQFGLPVACSAVTVLPEVAGGAAVFFDPEDTGDIADAIVRILSDDALRRDLSERGHRRAEALSWARTARIFRAIYRRMTGRDLSDEDRALLAPPTMLPQPRSRA
jgi:glycosyltransferase involved in cell wall biosynthesis